MTSRAQEQDRFQVAATAATSVALAEAARRAQAALRNQFVARVRRLWALLDRDDIAGTYPRWIAEMKTVTREYHQRSARAAARHYAEARELAMGTPTPEGTVRLALPPTDEWMERAYGYAGPGALAKGMPVEPGAFDAIPDTIVGEDREFLEQIQRHLIESRQVTADEMAKRADRDALTAVLGTANRIVLDGQRTTLENTVNADPVALGWYRVTDASPCAFCALIAARGAVYKSQDTAGRAASNRFTGSGLFKWHNDCGCTAAPVFSRTQELPEQNQRWAELYARTGESADTGDKLNAFRRAYERGEGAGRRRKREKRPDVIPGDTRTREQVRAQLAAFEESLPKVKSEAARQYHLEQIARLKRLLEK